jgi:superfamily II DNA helicase RecQ
MDLTGKLKQLLGPTTEFRPGQEPVIQAIATGKSPIIQVVGTGTGKSLSFILPAKCSSEGISIMVIPMVALQEDIQQRCKELEIDIGVWDSKQTNRAASIILVTPESAVTKGFQDFINRLQGRQLLDRVFIDECHMVLDCNHDFRPRLRELGRTISEWGIQQIFLTATLAPRDKREFYLAIHINDKDVYMFHSATTRKNVRYRVRKVSKDENENEVVCWEAQRYLKNNGKIIIYSNTIKRTEKLAEKLECPVYYNKVDTAEGKVLRIKEWLEEQRVIVVTNALGVGIDIPDIRAVIYAGKPKQLRDYAQESGRAGRDGLESEAVIIMREEKEKNQEQGVNIRDMDILEFVSGVECRRVILDRVMDGRMGRTECEEGELKCDICGFELDEEGNEEIFDDDIGVFEDIREGQMAQICVVRHR